MKSKETNNNCLYLHTTLDGKIFYVGIGNKIRPYSKSDRNKYWNNIVNKYGYIIEILVENLSWEKSCELEKLMISFYGRRDLGLGCLINMTDGGEGANGRIPSKETKKKISESRKGYKLSEESIKKRTESRKGFKHTEETRKKMSEFRKGFKHTEETRKKMSEFSKGYKHTEETRKKMSESLKKSIIQYDLKGNLMYKYDSINDAAIKLNLQQSNISNVCSGKAKKTGGFIFKYEIQNEL